jgi:DNA-binding CsgD family transcriptional regulator
MKGRASIYVAFAIQAVGSILFFWDLAAGALGLRAVPIGWNVHEVIEIGVIISLILGMVMSGVVLQRAHRRSEMAEEQLRLASGAFMTVLEERFDKWGLTPAEKDVALFALKGMSTQDIAQLRSTSEGTVKAQSNAIYRKAGVSGRSQLMSLFIEDLMADPLVDQPTDTPVAVRA